MNDFWIQLLYIIGIFLAGTIGFIIGKNKYK